MTCGTDIYNCTISLKFGSFRNTDACDMTTRESYYICTKMTSIQNKIFAYCLGDQIIDLKNIK
jgi:hypothetical protein